MSQFKSIQVTSQSISPTATSGFGVLYSSGSNLDLYWKNSAGTAYNLTSASAGSIQVLYYTGSAIGNDTRQQYIYNVPAGLRYLEIICIGAGGGGGGGGRVIGVNILSKALGGGGGAGVWYRVSRSQLLSSAYTASIGPGGAGGAGGTVSAGTAGVAGGHTWFSSSSAGDIVVLAAGGNGGANGAGSLLGQATTAGGLASNCIPVRFARSGKPGDSRPNNGNFIAVCPGNIFDITGHPVSLLATPSVGASMAVYQAQGGYVGGGGGGGGGRTSTGTYYSGFSGSSGWQNGVFIQNTAIPGTTAAAGSAGTNGTNNMILSLHRYSGSDAIYGLGGGGAGGGASTTVGNVGGNGGAGGLYGGGGGGGGGASGSTGGNGGSGSSGLCILIEYY
jgi:hypothetical protein